MTFLESLLTWANLPFMVALTTTVAFALIQATGVMGMFGADADGGGDSGGQADHDLGGGDASDHDVGGADHDAAGHRGAALGTTGVGRLPTTIIWQTFAMSFGMSGVVANTGVLLATGLLPVTALAVSLPAALVGGFATTTLVARLLRKVLKPSAKAAGRRDLVGLPGVVVSEKVDEEFGEVRLRAQHGDFVQVACRVFPGDAPIAHHEAVVVAKYDPDHDVLFVAPVAAEPGERPEQSRLRA